MYSVLFVCLGNICRSPAAEGILKQLVEKNKLDSHFFIQSCGLGDWHEGHLPDIRMRDVASARGIYLTSRAQEFLKNYFDDFDYIFAADIKVLHQLHEWARTPEDKSKVHLITQYSNLYKDQEIPDPFYGDQAQFEFVMTMLEEACLGIFNHLTRD